MGVDHRSHGGRTRELADLAGIPEKELLDFSANLNPLGPPPWLPEAMAEGLERIGAYPDPDSGSARVAAAARFGLAPERFLFADGADPLIFALPRALEVASCIAPTPCYSGYARAAERARVPLARVSLDAEDGFSLASAAFRAGLESAIRDAPGPTLLFLGAPNNPAGGAMSIDAVFELAQSAKNLYVALDESFAELSGFGDRAIVEASNPGAGKIIVLRSLTKTWAVPGLRAGFASASPSLLSRLRAELSAWPLSSFGEAFACRAMRDRDYPRLSAGLVEAEARRLEIELAQLNANRRKRLFRVHRSGANYLLIEFFPSTSLLEPAWRCAASLLERGIAVRTFAPAEGLDGRFMRIAVRTRKENGIFLAAFGDSLS